jgi:hypothetical protein
LVRLNLEKTSITDELTEHLSSLENLEYLNLHSTKISDAGLKQLSGLKHLKHLYIWQTTVSYDAAMKLQSDIPGLTVNLGADNPHVAEARLKAELQRVRAAKSDAERREAEAHDEQQSLSERENKLQAELSRLGKSDTSSNDKPGT